MNRKNWFKGRDAMRRSKEKKLHGTKERGTSERAKWEMVGERAGEL